VWMAANNPRSRTAVRHLGLSGVPQLRCGAAYQLAPHTMIKIAVIADSAPSATAPVACRSSIQRSPARTLFISCARLDAGRSSIAMAGTEQLESKR